MLRDLITPFRSDRFLWAGIDMWPLSERVVAREYVFVIAKRCIKPLHGSILRQSEAKGSAQSQESEQRE